MKAHEGYDCFYRSRWASYPNFKCNLEQDEKKEYLAVDVYGNPVTVITCCSYFHCYAHVFHEH